MRGIVHTQRLVLLLALASGAARAVPLQFESPHVHPLAVAGDRLFVVNTPDNRLSVFDASAGVPVLIREIVVGLEPVSVAAIDSTTAWVANHLSDDVSVVDVASGVVTHSIGVGDEPADIAFVKDPIGDDGSLWAVVTVSQEDRLVVIDADPPHAVIASLDLPHADPRAMVVSADSTGVWVAAFESGNRTTLVPRWFRWDGPWAANDPPVPPIVPPLNPALPESLMPDNGVIVRKVGGQWLDEQGGNWNTVFAWDVRDDDILYVDLSSGAPLVTSAVQGVGTLLYDLTLDANGTLWVANTEAHNEVFFEPKLVGEAVRNRVTEVSPGGAVTVHPLNPHIAFGPPGSPGPPSAPALRAESLAIPNEIRFAQPAGEPSPRLYVTAIGGERVAVLDPATGGLVRTLPTAEGATGIGTTAGSPYLYVVNRFENSLHVLDPVTGDLSLTQPIGRSGWDPTPADVKAGRPFLYSGRASAHGTMACASCHPHANLDALAWDLGDPTGDLVQLDPDLNEGQDVLPFHPLKGPMTTQSLRGLADSEPFHWRGDRADFTRFNPAFTSLLGSPDTLSANDMAAFETFILSVVYPPNPFRTLTDDMVPMGEADPLVGETDFLESHDEFCIRCHTYPGTGQGFVFELNTVPGFGNQPMKIPQLRNLYEKRGFDDLLGPDNRRGFGYMHDGQDHTLAEFLAHPETQLTPEEQVHVRAFLLQFPTGTHPVIGARVTRDSSNVDETAARFTDIHQGAIDGVADLVVHGVHDGAVRSFVWVGPENGGTYQSDNLYGGAWTTDDFLAAMLDDGSVFTWMAVPPGEGVRMGIDRDLDGAFDRDETLGGSDPADPNSLPPVAVGEMPPAAALTRVTGVAPQPFTKRATVEVYVDAPTRGTLDVFDVSGRRVRRLAEGRLSAGAQRFTWDGRDEGGRRVAAGAYWIRLDTDRGGDTRRIIRL